MQKVENNKYVEKDIFEKVRKCRLSITFFLNCYQRNGNTISKRII